MVRKIIWTSKAEKIFLEILEFYNKRNGTKTYSRKLNSEIQTIINLLKKFPYLGFLTDKEDIRIIIKGDYKIFYKIDPSKIVILFVWDCRQNPEDLKL